MMPSCCYKVYVWGSRVVSMYSFTCLWMICGCVQRLQVELSLRLTGMKTQKSNAIQTCKGTREMCGLKWRTLEIISEAFFLRVKKVWGFVLTLFPAANGKKNPKKPKKTLWYWFSKAPFHLRCTLSYNAIQFCLYKITRGQEHTASSGISHSKFWDFVHIISVRTT